MSAETNCDLIAAVEEKMSEYLTVSQMKCLKDSLREILTDYTLTVNPIDNYSGDKDDLLSEYLQVKSIEGRSPKTIERYRYIINRLIEYTKVPLSKINISHIRNYFIFLKGRGVSERTMESERSVYCSCFSWLFKEGYITKNPTINLSPIHYQKKVRLPFSHTDIELLKENCKSLRDKAIVCFLLSTGARICEVCQLNRSDIDLQGRECKVLGKGNKERTVYLDDVCVMMLKRYLDSRTDALPYLFVGKRMERLTDDGIRRMLAVLGKNSGVENVHPHRFRRTLATNLLNNGMAITEVSSILGHESISITSEYIYVDSRNVKNNYHRYA